MSKRFYDTAQLVAHRRKTIHYTRTTHEEAQQRISTWLQDPLLLRNIRHLTLTGDLYEDSIPDSDDLTLIWAPLVELVKRAARLTRVSFDFASTKFPLPLLQALQTYHPKVKLYIWGYYREEELDHTDATEQALASSPILRGIKCKAWVHGGGTNIDLRTAAFQRIVANAPNLELASFSQGHSGCVVRFPSPEDRAREQEAAAKFFLKSRGPNTSIRKLVLDGLALNKLTLVEWSKHISLPDLEDLKFSRGWPDRTYFEAAPALLTKLKHLSLNLSSASNQPEMPPLIEGYLATCAPLETLSLWSWMGVVSLETVLKHGATLKKLELHERETDMSNRRRGLLSTPDVRRIREECPRLEDLTLDLDREDADWRKDLDHHKDILEELARLGSRLQRIQIYLDLGITLAMASRQPQIRSTITTGAEIHDSGETTDDTTNNAVTEGYRGPFKPPSTAEMHEHGEQLWKVIFGESTQLGPRELDIKWGEWERKLGSGRPVPWVLWEQCRRRYVTVRPEERDDRQGEAITHVEGGFEGDDYDDDGEYYI